MSCPQCGVSVAASDPFCPKCGARRSSELPVPADPLRAEAAHDTLAGTEISGRVKAICANVDAHVRAAETVHMEVR